MFEETEEMDVVVMVMCDFMLRIHWRNKGEGRAG